MSTKAVGWAPANLWFAPGYNSLVAFDLNDIRVRCLSLPYYLATKFAAFYDRGGTDPRTSKDFEDIVYHFNYRTSLKEDILTADDEVRSYLTRCFDDVLKDYTKQEATLGNLYYEDQDFRFQKILALLREICLD